MTKYLNDSLTYTNDGRLLTSNGYSVMMDWEDVIMKESAKVICENGGRVLNIGFGLGLIDTYIQTYPIKEHWIIEAHTDVLSFMKKNGWYDNPNVHIVEGRWQDVLYSLPRFDGIYFDTWEDSSLYEMLVPYLPNLLNKHGIFSFWGDVYSNQYSIIPNRCIGLGMDVSYTDIVLPEIPNKEKQGILYWNPEITDYRVIRIQDNKKPQKPKSLI
jgi:hypothetical protein